MTKNINQQVTAVIVTYNRLSLLKQSVKAVLSQSKKVNHLLIVNNQSTDPTADWLATLKDERIQAINLDQNIGGAGGFNYAVSKSMTDFEDDFIWLMDDDTIPNEDALKELLNLFIKHPQSSFASSNTRWIDGSPALMNVVSPQEPEWPTYLNQEENFVQLKHATFVSLLIPRAIVLQIGLPQKEYFIWGDDIEYTERAAKIGPGFFVPNSIVIHKMKANTPPGNIATENDKQRLPRYFYEYRNRLQTARHRPFTSRVKTWLHSLQDFFQTLFGLHTKYRFYKTWLIIKGTVAGIFFRPKIEKVPEGK